MSLYNGPPRPGARGGRDQFSWDNVKADKDREYYLGHSVKALAGRWQKGRDVYWYTREKSGQDSIQDEIQAVKRREDELMMEAMGLKPKTVAKPAPKLDKHDLDELIKGKQDEQEQPDDAAAAVQEADRIKGLGYVAGTGPGLADAVRTTLPGVGPAVASGGPPGPAPPGQHLPPPPPRQQQHLPAGRLATATGAPPGGLRPGAALALAAGMTSEQLKELQRAEKRAKKEAKREAKKAKKEAKRAKKAAKKSRKEPGEDAKGQQAKGSASSSSDGNSSDEGDGGDLGGRGGGRRQGGSGREREEGGLRDHQHPDGGGRRGPYNVAHAPHDVSRDPWHRRAEEGEDGNRPSTAAETGRGRRGAADRQYGKYDRVYDREYDRDRSAMAGTGRVERGVEAEARRWQGHGGGNDSELVGQSRLPLKRARHDSPSLSPQPRSRRRRSASGSPPPHPYQHCQQHRHDTPSPDRGAKGQQKRRLKPDDLYSRQPSRLDLGGPTRFRHGSYGDEAVAAAARDGGGGGSGDPRDGRAQVDTPDWRNNNDKEGGRAGGRGQGRDWNRSRSPVQ
ncbi:hypothetical protein VaNZ11_015184 [Volvox africanus]|uniref:Multiple myeloma tumor-associated protein 2-like N-terminal domain-containing protein n=1 Tax=Volvox africanus TaxID=51714 RepID=A0ABQ5SLK7_9CHLO|nr:hypothetical protein VaNZ11_015184 [Volvox africanus]